MNRKLKIGLVALLALSTLFVGVRIVDPLSSTPSGPELDLSESPEEIAHDALLQLEYRDYTVEIRKGNERWKESAAVSLEPAYLAKFENSERQYIEWKLPERERAYFINPYFAWVKSNRGSSRGMSDPSVEADRFFDENVLGSCGCATVATENASMIVIEVHNGSVVNEVEPVIIGGGLKSATLRLVINKRTETLHMVRTRAVSKDYENPSITNVHVSEFRFSKWGTTEVERPSWATFTVEEAIKDAQNKEKGSWLGG